MNTVLRLIIFNSDHGDEFNDHGQFGHAHKNLHPELTFVPFVIRFPTELRVSPQRVSIPVQSLDIFPTIVGVVGIPTPQRLSGRNLLPIRELAFPERVTFSNQNSFMSLRTAQHALVVDNEGESFALFDSQKDPHEQSPLLNPREHPAFVPMKTKADLWHTKFSIEARKEPPGDRSQISEDLKRSLEALGYVQ